MQDLAHGYKSNMSDRVGAKLLRVAVVADWARCTRGEFWGEILNDEAFQRDIPNIAETYRLADLILRRRRGSGHVLTAALAHTDVLILNWDVANGDPDFGAHLAQQWFEHNASQIHLWVSNGGKLIIEGQAALSLPAQRAYDAILGPREVVVSGPELRGDPKRVRDGKRCVQAKAREAAGLQWLKMLSPDAMRTNADMFPGHAALQLSREWSRAADFNVMYRGWFVRRFRRTFFPWVPLYVTESGYPTMLAARWGKGAIFVSTMFLASTRQTQLIHELVQVDPADLPVPQDRWRAVAELAARWVLPTLIALYAAANVANVMRRELLKAGLALAAAIVLAGLPRLRRFFRRRWDRFTGR